MLAAEISETWLQKSRSSLSLHKPLERLFHHLSALQPKKSSDFYRSSEQEGYHLWTPLRENMTGAKQYNNWRVMAMRRTIETRFFWSELSI